MKKILYIACAAVAATFTACTGTADYDNYVETLGAQPAVIDTISSPQSYANYIENLNAIAVEFEQKDVKLDATQADEIATLGMKIQEALEAKYNQLAQTPMTLPDAFPVECDSTATACCDSIN